MIKRRQFTFVDQIGPPFDECTEVVAEFADSLGDRLISINEYTPSRHMTNWVVWYREDRDTREKVR